MKTIKDILANGENTKTKTANAPETTATAKNGRLKQHGIGMIVVTFMLVLSMLMIPPIKTRAADPVTTTVTFIVVTAA